MYVRYLPGRESGGEWALLRRGLAYGWIRREGRPALPSAAEAKRAWAGDEAVFLPGMLADALPRFVGEIAQARRLMERTRDGEGLADALAEEPYAERLQPDFELSSVSFEEHDDQGIEKVFFDAWQDDDIAADNLWCKASWLSFDEEEGSLRFRFSFGIEGYEDVAADPERELWAARLTDAVFPESRAVTGDVGLNALLAETLDCRRLEFTERIVYFNAPNGGALMHHDVERGHEGVVFAQMSGATFWLALSKPRLMDEIAAFLAQAPEGEWAALRALAADRQALAAHLDDPDHELAEQLIDREPGFFRQLVERGHAYVLEPGDVLLMPQRALDTCVWHSVICLGDEAGEGLSFALTRLGD
jgi:hypothetical protein